VRVGWNRSLSRHLSVSSKLVSRPLFAEARIHCLSAYVLCQVLAGGLAFPPKILYSTPLGYRSRKECGENSKSYKENFMKDKLLEISKEKQKLLSRIKRLAGQITAVEHSVTDGDECADILMLLAAIRGGVNSLMAEILEDHIRLHISHPDRGKESNDELTEDLIGLVRAYLK
jgi:DNA-binding FrmR family transcriptional regulator